MNPWEQFLEVQRLDTSLDQLDHRWQSIPEREALEAIPDEVTELERETTAREERRHDLVRSQRRLEDEISSLSERRDHASSTLYGGTVTAPKELEALQDEIASIGRRIGSLEDETLEIMELLEPVDADLDELATKRADLDRRAAALQQSIDEAEEEIEAERREVLAEREAAVEGISDDLLERYEKARARLGGVAVARLSGGRCDGCHMALSAVELDRIKHLPAEEPVTCEECGRFLVR